MAILSAAISPDGKYLAYSDQTGEAHMLPQTEGYSVTSWFPDGTRMVASSSSGNSAHGIFVVSMLGSGAPRKIHESGGLAWVSPDGSKIAFIGSSSNEIWMMGPSGEEPHILHPVPAGDLVTYLSWSPDGQRVAWNRNHQESNRVHSFIESRGLRDERITTLASDKELPGGASEFIWLKDGRLLCALRELPPHQLDLNLWEIPTNVRVGQGAGRPKRLTNWAGFNIKAITASADGKRLAFVEFAAQTDVSIGELEAGGAKMKTPRRLTLDESNDRPTAWMPDSKAVLFNSDRTGNFAIFKQEIDKESAEAVVSGKDDAIGGRVSADQQWILYRSGPPQTSGTTSLLAPLLMRIPIAGGPPQIVFESPGSFGMRCTRPPVNFCLCGEYQAKERVYYSLDPLKGKGHELFRQEFGSGDADVSHDGQRFAYVLAGQKGNRIRFLNASGQPVRDMTVDGWEGFNSLDWAVDGKGLYVGSWTPKTGATLLYIELNGKTHPLWRQHGNFRTWGIPSPDGRYLAILSGTTDNNVWMLEGF